MGQTSFLFSGFLSSSIWKRADAVLKRFFIFLAWSASDFITGQIIYLDGGLTPVD